MDTKGRKLFRYVAGIMTAVVLMGSAYVTTAMASGIGLIDTADLLDVHAEASDSSDVVGQVMDEGHVAILGRADGWVQIKAGEIIGWVPEENLIETEVSNEEAYEANQKVVAEFAEDVREALEDVEADSEEAQPEEEEEDSEAGEQTVSDEEEFSKEDAEQEASLEEASAEQEDEEKELLNAEELAREQARLLAEAQKQAQEQAEAFAREQAKAVEAVQKLAEEQAKAAEEQAKAAQEAQMLAEEQAKAAALAQKQAQEQAKAAELAQKQEAQEAISQEALNAANVSEEDLELLASIIYCEANGEPYIGKVAVGNVVLNRVKSSRYPDTIKGVIYAKGQFSPVKNGSMAKALKYDSADASCYQAALEALAGSAPVGEKTSFRRVNGRSGQVIGHHVFY